MNNVLAVILAGGKGERLEPLTRDRAKPAVPFGGGYRIIDFTLSNCLNSGLRKMLVLTQYKAMSLDRHINLGWQRLLVPRAGRVHRRRAAAAAHRRALVPGHGRRRLSEHLHAGKRAARVRRDPGRRPHLQDGLRQPGRVPQGEPGRSDGQRPARAGQRVAALRRDRSRPRPADRRLSRKSRPCRPRFPATTSTSSPRWASTCSRPGSCSSSCASTPRGRAAVTTSAATSFPRSSTRTACSPFRFATRTASRTPTGATWARSTPTSRPTWT